MSEFLRFAVLGLGFGALYALAAQGVVLIYRGSGIINFAQGAMGMVGAFVYYELHYQPVALGGGLAQERWAFWPALAVGVAASALLGLLTYVLVMRPLRHASPLARLVATLGVLTILTSLAATGPEIGGLFDWGATPISLPTFYPFDVYDLGNGVTLAAGALIVLGVTVGLTAVLWLVYRYTRFGLATTAVAENQRAASSLGWSPDAIAGANWALGAGLAGLAGVLIIPFFGGITVFQLTSLVLAALAAALVGRFTSFPITLLAGLFIGVLQSTLAHYLADVDWLERRGHRDQPVRAVPRDHRLPGVPRYRAPRAGVHLRSPAGARHRSNPTLRHRGGVGDDGAADHRALAEVGRRDHHDDDLRDPAVVDRDGDGPVRPALSRPVGPCWCRRIHRGAARCYDQRSLRARGTDRDRRHDPGRARVRVAGRTDARCQPRDRHARPRHRGAEHRVQQH